ncbi:hypothetical protein FB451DRAFT_589516 [Mycena latifolia]|nr:hypothetical protein FB451DRAFT_589516 [Mycena latifolia]
MASPFTSKLGTNYCPQDDEIPAIQCILAETAVRVKGLDDEIADLQKALDKLTEERDRLNAYVDAHQALLSPVRRLPLDIIHEIFVACLPMYRNCAMSAMEAPVLLGRICSSWRTISLSIPRLWSRLHIVEPSFPFESSPILVEEKLEQILAVTSAWLRRSGQCALSISLHSELNAPGLIPPVHDRLAKAIVPFSSRWEHITFVTSSPALATFSHFTAADVPMLKSIAVRLYDPHTVDAANKIQWSSWGLFQAPDVSSVGISLNSYNPLELPLRWSRLTNLSLSQGWGPGGRSVTSKIARQVLARCPELQVCKLIVYDGRTDSVSPTSEPDLELPFLHTLSLQCGDIGFALCQLFDSLSLPLLRHFKLRGYCRVDSDISFAPFLAATPRFQTLDINVEAFTRSSLAVFFRGLPPTVQKLQLVDISTDWATPSELDVLSDDILTLLTDSSAPCCPGLQELRIDDCQFFSDKELLRFILARMTDGGNRTLTRVQVRFQRQVQLDILSELQPFIETGLHVELDYLPPLALRFSPWEGLSGDNPPQIFF